MTGAADVELPPLPPRVPVDKHLPTGVVIYGYTNDMIRDYARDYARANVAAKDAEIEALRAEVERLTGCLATANANHEQFERQWYLERDRAERLAEALREMIELREATQRGEVHPTRHELDIVKDARALLRDQEEGSGFWPEMPKNGGPDWTGFDG